MYDTPICRSLQLLLAGIIFYLVGINFILICDPKCHGNGGTKMNRGFDIVYENGEKVIFLTMTVQFMLANVY